MLDEELYLTNYTFSFEAKEEFILEDINVKNLKDLKLYEFDDRYLADSKGNVYRIKKIVRGKYLVSLMNPYITRDRYVEFVLTDKKGKKKHIQGQRIVAGLFLQEVPNKPFVNHKNGIRDDNRLENLEYMSHSENVKHSWDYLRKR